MDVFDTRELRLLTQPQSGLCVTLTMPLHVGGGADQRDALRLKNLLHRAEEEMIAQGMRGADARLVLSPARELITDSLFWNNSGRGLAMFISTELFRRYRLPLALDEAVDVKGRFYLKPLLPMLVQPKFYLLTLSRNRPRLYEGTTESLEEIDVPQLHASMKEALNYDQAERGSQIHSASRPAVGKQPARGKQAAVFHGHGGQDDAAKNDLATYFRTIDAALRDVLRDESAPLVLAGVEYVLPIYRQVASYPHIAEEGVSGNCDYLATGELHQRAWPIAEPLLLRERDEAVEKFRRLCDTGQAISAVESVVPAAFAGRVDTLFVDRRARLWGVFDPQSNTVQTHRQMQPGDDDLFDLAAVQTLLHRGNVYTAEGQPPLETPLAALLRY